MTPSELIMENRARNRALTAPVRAYDPVTGRGCPGVRVPYTAPDGTTHMVPAAMASDPRLSTSTYHTLRCRYDFPYWLATTATVYSTTANRPVHPRPSTLQLALLDDIENARRTSRAARMIVFHSAGDEPRALTTLYLRWLEFLHTPGANTLHVVPDSTTARTALRELHHTARHTPGELHLPAGRGTVRRFGADMLQTRRLRKYSRFTTCRTPSRLRGGIPYHYSLISRATRCSYVDDYRRPTAPPLETALAVICGSSDTGLTVVESDNRDTRTRRRYFYELWEESLRGDTALRPHFYAWHQSDRAVLPLPCPAPAYYTGLSPYELHLWNDHRLSLEQINWYRHATGGLSAEETARLYPVTATEAAAWHLDEYPDRIPEEIAYANCEKTLDLPVKGILSRVRPVHIPGITCRPVPVLLFRKPEVQARHTAAAHAETAGYSPTPGNRYGDPDPPIV